MDETSAGPAAVVRHFCEVVCRRDLQQVRPLLTDDVVYHNIPMEPATGLEATLGVLGTFYDMFEAMEFRIVHLAVDGSTVLTERVDVLTSRGRQASLPVMGAFEVTGDQIAAWRDYFDMAQVTAVLTPEGS